MLMQCVFAYACLNDSIFLYVERERRRERERDRWREGVTVQCGRISSMSIQFNVPVSSTVCRRFKSHLSRYFFFGKRAVQVCCLALF